MAKKTYVFITDLKTPRVVGTGIPHAPQKIEYRTFRKGDTVNGEMKHVDNKPAVILIEGNFPIPLHAVKELVAKDLQELSGADGSKDAKDDTKAFEMESKISISKNPKVAYLDAIVIGSLLGAGAMYLAEKKNWVQTTDKYAPLYAALGGAALGAYLVYRHKNSE